METTILIAILCVFVGVLLGLLLLKKNGKDMDTEDKTTVNKLFEKKEPMEFSKKILVASYAIAIVVILYTMYIIYLMVIGDYIGDPSSLNTLIMLTLGELGAANSFYFWKARTENMEKIRRNRGFVEAEEIKHAVNNEDY